MFSRRFFYVAFCYTVLNAWPAGVKAEDPVSVPLPHSDCTRTTNGTIVECIRSDNYTIPGNFDVTLFPTDVTTIMVGKVSVNPTGRKTNTIHNDAPPLPADLNALRTVSLFHFQGTNGTRVPFEAFLVNVRDRLTALHFKYCRIGTLGANFLNGFVQLRILDLNDNDISQIHLDAFEGLPSLPQSGPVLLDTLQLAQNQITAVDWTVFAPVANSLSQLALESQKVRS
ncbi:uncharacterized protein LOC129594882 [Paramacrobiotus metropolitanus]|uniref:uncharacterized protein LOC129594882 n=1 Tax=Paramacrobiotus metropolitanus TaxID=2943436 RepID=UPI002445F235|nr:uncharacterized protein LOC129594882 [Paramacrobiotus metropolitanus]